MDFPTSWPLTVRFLVAEQQKLERLPAVSGGLPPDADVIDLLCLQYASTSAWPTTLSQRDKEAVFQRFLWARMFCAALLHSFRKADGSETGHMPYPDWQFEPMLVWLLVELWRLRESIQKDGMRPLPHRPPLPWPPGPTN